MKKTSAALALSFAAALALPAGARAQGAPAAAPDAVAPLPALAYDTYFEPFTDNPLYRLHAPEPLTTPPPLFTKFDPLEGLTRPAKVSRVALPGDRYVAFMPLMTARVSDEITVPVAIKSLLAPVTSLRVFVDYDPAVIVPIGYAGAGIPTEDPYMNPHPDPSYIGDCTNCLIAFTTLIEPWSKTGPMLNLKFRAVSAGTSPLTVHLVEISDYTQNMRPTVFQDGLLRVAAK